MTSTRPKQLAYGLRSPAGVVLDRLATKQRFPVSAIVGLTERCNLRCAHCFVTPPEQERCLSTERLTTFFDELRTLGVLFLTFTGGETALRSDLSELVDAATERSFLVRLKSNGTLLTSQRLRDLREAGLAQLDISLYHRDSVQHDQFVGSVGAWQKAMNAAATFQALGGLVRLSLVAMEWNRSVISEMVQLAEDRGYNYTLTPTIICQADCEQGLTSLQMGEDELVELLRDERLMDPEATSQQQLRTSQDALCRAGQDTVYVAPNGDVQLCQLLPWPLGNLRKASLAQIWTSSPVRREFLQRRWGDLPECSDCELSWACSRCSANALRENGDALSAAKGDCLLARARARICSSCNKDRRSAGG